MEPQQRPDRAAGVNDSLAMMYVLCSILCNPIDVFIRRGFGKNFFGWNSVYGVVLVLLIAGSADEPAMTCFFFAWLLVQSLQRINTYWLLWYKGAVIHTRYSGYPWLGMRMPFVDTEEKALWLGEPVACLVAGALLLLVSPALGKYIMCGAITFLVRHGLDRWIERQRMDTMTDAWIEQKHYSEQFRNRRR